MEINNIKRGRATGDVNMIKYADFIKQAKDDAEKSTKEKAVRGALMGNGAAVGATAGAYGGYKGATKLFDALKLKHKIPTLGMSLPGTAQRTLEDAAYKVRSAGDIPLLDAIAKQPKINNSGAIMSDSGKNMFVDRGAVKQLIKDYGKRGRIARGVVGGAGGVVGGIGGGLAGDAAGRLLGRLVFGG